MIAGPLTVIQTSETKPANTAAAAAGPRWAAASVAVGPEEDEAGQVGLWLKVKGRDLRCRRATAQHALVWE